MASGASRETSPRLRSMIFDDCKIGQFPGQMPVSGRPLARPPPDPPRTMNLNDLGAGEAPGMDSSFWGGLSKTSARLVQIVDFR